MNTLTIAFLSGLLAPLDVLDTPPDTRVPFEPLRPLPEKIAYETALRQTAEIFHDALASKEAQALLLPKRTV